MTGSGERVIKKVDRSPLICATKTSYGYRITSYNGVYLGDVKSDIDGYYRMVFNLAGCWDSTPLRDIVDFLEHLNAEWDEQVQKECGK